MLVKKNKAREAMEEILGFGFEELEFVGLGGSMGFLDGVFNTLVS